MLTRWIPACSILTCSILTWKVHGMPVPAIPPTVTIGLQGLRFVGRHGVLPSEHLDPQDFLVDCEIEVPAPDADELDRTIDYAALSAEVAAIVEGDHVNLIETLAERIAAACLAHETALAVTVRVHKPNAPIPVEFADISATVHRRKR